MSTKKRDRESKGLSILKQQGFVAFCKYRVRKIIDKCHNKFETYIFYNEGLFAYYKYLYWRFIVKGIFLCFRFVYIPKNFGFAVCGAHGVGLHSLLYFISKLHARKISPTSLSTRIKARLLSFFLPNTCAISNICRHTGGGGVLPLGMFAMRKDVTKDIALQINYELSRNADLSIWGITLDGRTEGKEDLLYYIAPEYKVPVICLVRDPILALISAANIGLNYSCIAKKITPSSSVEEINVAIEEVMSERIESLYEIQAFNSAYTTILDWYSNLSQMFPYASEILYIDTSDLIGSKTKTTIQKIATFIANNHHENFDLKVPDNFDFDLKVNDFLTHNLPLEFEFMNHKICVSAFKGAFKIGLRQCYHYNDKRFYIDMNYHSSFFPNRRLFISTSSKSFPASFVESLNKEIEKRLEVIYNKILPYHSLKITPKIFLDFLARNLNKAEILRSTFDYELQHVKQNRPDIVATWEYYKEFQKLFTPTKGDL